VHWIGGGWHPVFLMLLVAVAGWHSSLGVQVVIEDYVHGAANKTALLLISLFAHALLVTAGLYAVLRIALRSFG
jgi:succinate dehydrogenase / fumarate reductase membrane anchor subunit